MAKSEFLKNVAHSGDYLRQQLQQLSNQFQLGEVRGEGLLLALEIPQGNANEIAAAAFETGLLINAVRPHILRFMPALNVSVREIDAMVEALASAIAIAR